MLNYDVEIIEDRELFSKTATVIFDERTDNLERTGWLNTRKKSIGGSEIGAIAGFNKYASALTVFNEKLDLVKPFKGNEFTKNGQRLESFIRYYVQEDFKEETGIKLTTFEYPFMMLDKELPFLSANIDGLAILDKEWTYRENRDTGEIWSIPKGEIIGIEIKTASEYTSTQWCDEEIPSSYLAQIYHYMGITGLKFFLIIYKIGASIKWKVVPRNEDDIAYLRSVGKDFWENNILTKTPPNPTGLVKETEEITEQQDLREENINLSNGLLAKYKDLGDKIKELETEKEKTKQEIFLSMGNAKKGTDGAYKISRFTVSRDSLDNKKLKDLYPETYKNVLKGTTEFINLRISEIK